MDIGAVRFVERAPGQMWLERGLYGPLTAFRMTSESPVLSTVSVPPEARDKVLIQLEAWNAYQHLGPEAVVNFAVDESGPLYVVGPREYLPVAISPEPKLSGGKLVNIAARGWASATNKLVGGFVVDEQHHWVLIRAVGPGLSAYGVTDAMSNPYLTLYKSRTIIGYNDDWSKRPDAADISAAATKVGAFPLSTGSGDAALLVELAPGNYTAQVEPESGSGGTALIEVYSVPET